MSQTTSFSGSLTAQQARNNTHQDSFSRFLGRFQAWRERTRSRRDLMRLNEHQLKDIGLSRHDAESEWQKPFWQD
jgi:uncharacterized protein YjiS (DUF1127 family)